VERSLHEAPAGDDPTGANRPSQVLALFADRLNRLFDESTGPKGFPFTSREVAFALLEDGHTISESLIERLRSGSGDMPAARIIEALAYFFNVDVAYFPVAGSPSEASSAKQNPEMFQPPNLVLAEPTKVDPIPAIRAQVVEVTVADLGQIVAGMSEAASECLSRGQAQTQLAIRLLLLISDVGSVLSLPREKFIISRPLLRQITVEWRSAAQIESRYKPILDRFSRIADED